MKTSNKILSGAFLIIVVIMIIANFVVKQKVDEIKTKNGEIYIEETDSVKADSISGNIQININ